MILSESPDGPLVTLLMVKRFVVLTVYAVALESRLEAQVRPDPRGSPPPWIDTTGESGVYPIGDAVGVYRAALDLIYKDGDKRPPVIVLHDTAEGRSGEGPCPVACEYVWPHKSKIDTATILSFARFSPKRPRIQNFGYDIPIVLLSYHDVERMRRDGLSYLATQRAPANMPGMELWVELSRRYPGVWGLATLTKVGFNNAHTEALVQVSHSCGATCGSSEILFLKRTNAKWTVVERIPSYAEAYLSRGALRYRGPAGTNPSESELIFAPSNRASRSEAEEEAPIYRAVLDSLYSFQGSSPKMLVLTDRIRMPDGILPKHRSRIDSVLLQRYLFLGAVRASPDSAFKYRLPVAILPGDSIPRLEDRGTALQGELQFNTPFWVAFREKYPNAWGMIGFSRVAFNFAHTQALVYSHHECGGACRNGDTWLLQRTGERWRISERIPRESENNFELEPLRYVGADAKPNSYRHRQVTVRLTNAVTLRPLSALRVSTFGNIGKPRILVTNSAGRIALGKTPFNGAIGMNAMCPDTSSPQQVMALNYVASPGLDTLVDARVDFRECLRPPPGERVQRTLSGAQAFIGDTLARFVFPRRDPIYTWDLPLKGTYPGSPEYMWEVSWRVPEAKAGEYPFSLLMITGWKPGGPRKGSLAELIASRPLEEMIHCTTCDVPAMFSNPSTVRKNVFASAENDHLVFTVRGREAVRQLFPTIPTTVKFEKRVRQVAMREYGPGDIEEGQNVLVNCRSSDSTAASRHRCDVPSGSHRGQQIAGSTAPRRMRVLAISYDGASLVRNLDVRIRSEDRKKPVVVRSTGAAGEFVLLHPASDSVTLEAVCKNTGRRERPISGLLGLYVAPGTDTTVQLLVHPDRCPR
jgi:hypothetical protein